MRALKARILRFKSKLELRPVEENLSKHHLSPAELEQQLHKQILFMERSGQAYDQGFEDEAVRLAVCIRVLLHDTERVKSLLQLLGMKGKIEYWDSASEHNPSNLIAHLGLVSLRMSVKGGELASSRYMPMLDDLLPGRGSWESFIWWWNKKPVIVDAKKNTFTRRDLVLNLCDKDGGAHVDPSLGQPYADLSRFNSAGWIQHKGGKSFPFDNSVAHASVRQIAHEVIKTIRHSCGD